MGMMATRPVTMRVVAVGVIAVRLVVVVRMFTMRLITMGMVSVGMSTVRFVVMRTAVLVILSLVTRERHRSEIKHASFSFPELIVLDKHCLSVIYIRLVYNKGTGQI